MFFSQKVDHACSFCDVLGVYCTVAHKYKKKKLSWFNISPKEGTKVYQTVIRKIIPVSQDACSVLSTTFDTYNATAVVAVALDDGKKMQNWGMLWMCSIRYN